MVEYEVYLSYMKDVNGVTIMLIGTSIAATVVCLATVKIAIITVGNNCFDLLKRLVENRSIRI